MKTKHSLIFTLITFVMLSFLPNSFAQGSRPIVRLIYFVPSDRQPQPDIETKFDKLINDVQQGYEEIMAAHGFGKKTFLFETDAQGNAVVHTVNGEEPEKHYNNEQIIHIPAISREITEQSFDSKNINLVAIDVSSAHLGGSAQIGGIAQAYWAHEGGGGFALMPASGPNFSIGVAAHELGHTFGLSHDVRSDARKVSVDTFDGRQDFYTSFCAAEWLNVSRFFNEEQSIFNEEPTIEMLPPSFVSAVNVIHLRFKVAHHEGIHQVQLRTPGLKVRNATTGDVLIGCVKLNGNMNATVEFGTSSLTPQNEKLTISIIDVQGNHFHEFYPIDVLSLLPPPEVPDANLAAAIRDVLGLASEAPITQLDMLRLTDFVALDRKITNLTGLEFASNLNFLTLSYNQIEDIKPISKLPHVWNLDISGNQITDISSLKGMKSLTHLSIGDNQISDISDLPSIGAFSYSGYLNIGRNPIGDITPIWKLTGLTGLSIRYQEIDDLSRIKELTRLTFLQLDENNISDIIPLSSLTNLTELILWRNKITDTRPLVNLTNLKRLELQDNPITNRKPLLELRRKNPDVKIYLEWGREPLPVTLSHFRAERIEVGVAIKWTTESEIDNAGFYLYRSETKDGEFKVVNPTMIQGAGTTGERNEYTWTDTTAKPNTLYYYRIEDVSYSGVREQLTTVRLRGLISANGKMTTQWADIKTGQ